MAVPDRDAAGGWRQLTGDEVGSLRLDPSDVESAHMEEIDAHAGASRIPILFCGPLLHRLGEAFIPDLGGCRIGDRPINYHLDILRQFGAHAQLKRLEQGRRRLIDQQNAPVRIHGEYAFAQAGNNRFGLTLFGFQSANASFQLRCQLIESHGQLSHFVLPGNLHALFKIAACHLQGYRTHLMQRCGDTLGGKPTGYDGQAAGENG